MTEPQEDVIHLSERDAQALMEALDNPRPPSPKLVEAAQRYKALMGMIAWNNEAFSPEALANVPAFTVTWDGNPIGEAYLTEDGIESLREIMRRVVLYGEPVDAAYERCQRQQAMIRWSDAVERSINALVARAKLRAARRRARLSTQVRHTRRKHA